MSSGGEGVGMTGHLQQLAAI
ncbi:hypothetical protein ACI2J5_12365 [Agrobacterium pusense]|nr:hypothetical protein [Agrobacterium pusense]